MFFVKASNQLAILDVARRWDVERILLVFVFARLIRSLPLSPLRECSDFVFSSSDAIDDACRRNRRDFERRDIENPRSPRQDCILQSVSARFRPEDVSDAPAVRVSRISFELISQLKSVGIKMCWKSFQVDAYDEFYVANEGSTPWCTFAREAGGSSYPI